jgi:putative membrane protein
MLAVSSWQLATRHHLTHHVSRITLEHPMSDPSKQNLAEDRTSWAEDRTEWAQQRTLLAKERTFSAWIRTGLSCMAAGIGITRLLGDIDSYLIASGLGTLLIVTSGIIFVIAFLSYRKTLIEDKKEGVEETSLWLIGVISLFMVMGAVLALILVFVE